MPKDKNRPDTSGLDLLGAEPEENVLSPGYIWKLYKKGLDFNASINLDETVRVNENFFVGKQWEGVQANGLPTPVFNILKRVCCFIVATISSENIKVTAAPLSATPGTNQLVEPARIINEELDALTERNNIAALMREYARNAAVDGDSCPTPIGTLTLRRARMQRGVSARRSSRTTEFTSATPTTDTLNLSPTSSFPSGKS